MSFNIWLGGDVVDFGGVVRAIHAADADIVGLQEAEGNTGRIAKALGWPYWSDRLHVVSRYPLIDPPGAAGQYVLAQVKPGQVFALANEHLPSDPYGPYLVRDGKTLAAGPAQRARHAHAGGPRGAPRRPPRARRRDPDADDRGLQRAVVPRLDAGDRRHPQRPALPGRVAGEPRGRRRGVPGHLPRRPSRPGREPRDHVDLRVSVPAPAQQRGRRPDRLRPGLARHAGARQRDRRAVRHARRHRAGRPVAVRPPRGRLDRAAHARRRAALRVGDRPPRRAGRPDPRALRGAAEAAADDAADRPITAARRTPR